jgi:hypothetical protein
MGQEGQSQKNFSLLTPLGVLGVLGGSIPRILASWRFNSQDFGVLAVQFPRILASWRFNSQDFTE